MLARNLLPRAVGLAERSFHLARKLRTSALWLLGPADLLFRRLHGRGDRPPLWLRRHSGPLRDFEGAARDMEATLLRLELVRSGDRVLEIGCGAGAMLPAFARLLGPEGRYVGFDVHGPSIRWCRRIAADPRFRFELAEIASPYGDPTHWRAAETYRFPVDDAGADFILAKSVFTHLLEGEARHYLREIRRTLRPGRLALITAFCFDSARLTARPPAFPLPAGDSPVRWMRRLQPRAAVAFDRRLFEQMTVEAGLTVRDMVAGFWPGSEPVPRGQDVLILAAGGLAPAVD